MDNNEKPDFTKNMKDLKLKDINKIVNLVLDPKTAINLAFEWLEKNDCHTIKDIITKREQLLKLLTGNEITQKELEAIVIEEVNKFRWFDYIDFSEMKEQHLYTWELILLERLYVLPEENNNEFPRIWGMRTGNCDDILDSCKKFYIKRSGYMYIKHPEENDQSSPYFACSFNLLDFKYKEITSVIKPYLKQLPEKSLVMDYRPSVLYMRLRASVKNAFSKHTTK